jgi:hypothetical protein
MGLYAQRYAHTPWGHRQLMLHVERPCLGKALPLHPIKNKCGPGQPPKPHCCRGCFRLPSSARDGRSTEALTSGFDSQRFHPALEEDRRRPQCPGPGSLEMNRVPRRFTLERIVGNAESWPAAFRNILALWLRTLCRSAAGERNGKLGRRCAKGVERSKFLWKEKEKRAV